jgi:hypothetical protein
MIHEPEIGLDGDNVVMAELVHPGGRWLPWVVAAVLVCAFFVVDVVFKKQWQDVRSLFPWLPAILMGFCVGQVNLIAVWASLAPGNIVLRISAAFLLTMAMWYGLILGSRPLLLLSAPGMTRSDAILLIGILLASVVILQVPLWIAKKVFRWRLTRQPGDTAEALQEDRQFHLQHLLIAMFLFAIALSPLRQVLPPVDGDPFGMRYEWWVLLPAMILCNLVVTLPCVWWAFAPAPRLIRLILGWPVYCGVLTAVEFVCLWLVIGRPGPRPYEDAIIFFLLNFSQCVAVLGTLWILRAIGFRMVRMPRAGRPMGASPFQTIVQTEQP